MSSEPIYKITFFNQQEVYEIFAKQVFQSDLWGFLEVEEFVFGERSHVIVDPAEEKLKNEKVEAKPNLTVEAWSTHFSFVFIMCFFPLRPTQGKKTC